MKERKNECPCLNTRCCLKTARQTKYAYVAKKIYNLYHCEYRAFLIHFAFAKYFLSKLIYFNYFNMYVYGAVCKLLYTK